MNPLPRFRKTRIAPTPSGYLHRGNALSFLLTAALARQTGAQVLLRIDDLDELRVRPAYVQHIFDTLQQLQIPWHEGPRSPEEQATHFAQVHRLPLYRSALEKLQKVGHLFACNCSRATILAQDPTGVYHGTCLHKGLPLDAEGVCWRVHTTPQAVGVKTLNGPVIAAPLPPAVQYFMVRKRDGMPAYQLASLVDDLHFGIDLVVRGADLWPSTLAQLYLASLLGEKGFSETTFYHHPLLQDARGHKLSKSAGAEAVKPAHDREGLLSCLAALLQGKPINGFAGSESIFLQQQAK
ncbi:MAG: tRNA glutamyl-Q synthetase [Chitinophagaceae bacterium]|nr:MAG: tRNA glutamyl-Q synthetase [Chitinophagaceae bacterium]